MVVRLEAQLCSRSMLKPCTSAFEYMNCFALHFPLVYMCRLASERIGGNMNKKALRHDRHTVSLLTDHMVFAPKYRGKILTGDVAMITEGIICKTCKELDIEIIEIAVKD